METKTIVKNLHSHPKQKLFDHINGVKELLEIFSKDCMSIYSDEKRELYQSLATITVAFHDLAKSTTYFQKYILSNKEEQYKTKKNREKEKLCRHSLFSAIAGCYFAYQWLKKQSMSEKDCRFYSSLVDRKSVV